MAVCFDCMRSPSSVSIPTAASLVASEVLLKYNQAESDGLLRRHVHAHATAESGGVRPFGVSLLMAGYDDNGPQLYQIDPSGSYFAWKASAIGKNMTNAKTFLEKRYSEVGAALQCIQSDLS